MSIGCCSSFKLCSDKGKCIHIESPLYEEFYKDCLYAENLAKGLNFYTKYNENNQHQAYLYKKKLEGNNFSVTDTNKDNAKQEKYRHSYITIEGRQFYIGLRSSYGGYSYSLSREDIEKFKDELGECSLEITRQFIESDFKDEGGTEEDRAEWRVYVTIGEKQYNIMNSNIRCLREETARMVAEYLNQKGLKAVCECLGSNKRSFLTNKIENSKSVKANKTKELKATQQEGMQISFF